ncbi:MAG: hypothetical protein V2J62_11300 [candidate division KSB1 bacterium]|jgi:hypothetical protein|nr:hypothetical protein [candidate division KSB1 bacterium]
MNCKLIEMIKAIILLMAFFCAISTHSQVLTFDLSENFPDITVSGKSSDANTGEGLAFGDVNGDGFDDIVIGVPESMNNGTVGHIYIIFGCPKAQKSIDLDIDNPDVTISGADSAGKFAINLETDDFNSDGIKDIFISEPFANPEERAKAGIAYLFLGSQRLSGVIENPLESADLVFYGANSGDHLGVSLASGDINNDGRKDFIIGADGVDSPNSVCSGATYVIVNSTNMPSTGAIDLQNEFDGHVIYGNDPNDFSGRAISCTDINRDGNDDVIICAHKADTPVPNVIADAGEVYVVFMKQGLPHIIDLHVSSPDITILGDERRGWLGYSIFSCDIDDDQYGDLIISAPQVNRDSLIDAGAVYVFSGRTIHDKILVDLDLVTPALTITGPSRSSNLGSSLDITDLDGNGHQDLLIGASQHSYGDRNSAGAAFLISDFFSQDKTIDLHARKAEIAVFGETSSGFLGHSVRTGDFDGDALQDILMSAPECDAHGKVYCLFGQRFTGIDKNDLTTIAPDNFVLERSYPNPFSTTGSTHKALRSGTHIRYEVMTFCYLNASIYNIRGEKVIDLLTNHQHTPGTYEINWNGRDHTGHVVSSGIYFASFRSETSIRNVRMVLIE